MPTRSFTQFVRTLEKNPVEKRALDAARKALREKFDRDKRDKG